MKSKISTIFAILVFSFVSSAAPAAASVRTFDPDPPNAGEPLTITEEVEWEGCAAGWSYVRTVEFAPWNNPGGQYPTTIFTVINAAGTGGGTQVLNGFDIQTLPDYPALYSMKTTTTITCGGEPITYEQNESIIIAEDGVVPVVSMPVAAILAVAGYGGFVLLGRRKKKPHAV